MTTAFSTAATAAAMPTGMSGAYVRTVEVDDRVADVRLADVVLSLVVLVLIGLLLLG